MTAMLAEIFMLRIEAAARGAKEPAQFVPITLPPSRGGEIGAVEDKSAADGLLGHLHKKPPEDPHDPQLRGRSPRERELGTKREATRGGPNSPRPSPLTGPSRT